jgi:DNA-binding beta-propeller fold protein YncE
VRAACLSAALALTLGIGSLAESALGAAPPFKYEQAATEKLDEAAPGGAFFSPDGLAFDATGDLYVADVNGNHGEGVIDKFGSSDAFMSALGVGTLSGTYTEHVAVDDATGDIYVADSNHSEIFVLKPNGEELSPPWKGTNTTEKSFGGGCCFVDVAVDNSSGPSKGDVYVMTGNNGGEVDVFEPRHEDKEEGRFIRRLEAPGGFEFREANEDLGLAVNDSSGAEAGEVYVSDWGHDVIDRFSVTGSFEAAHRIVVEAESAPAALAVDSASGDVFVSEIGRVGTESGPVYDYAPDGTLLTKITGTGPGEPFDRPDGLAVQQAGPDAGELYVSDQGADRVDVFAQEHPAPPDAQESSVANVSAGAATFLGEIYPHGLSTQYRFEYGRCATATTCSTSPYEQSTPTPDGSVGSEGDYSTKEVGPLTVAGLSADTEYHYRLIAHNTHGETVGEEHTFTTQRAGEELSLPDSRDWELVSPPNKLGASLGSVSEAGLVQAAASGEAISYIASGPTEPEPAGFVASVQVLSTRNSGGGWSTRDIESPHETPAGAGESSTPEYVGLSEELSSSVVQPYGPLNPKLFPEASEQTAFLHVLGTCTTSCWHPLVTGKAGFANVPAGTSFGEEGPCEEGSGSEGSVSSQCGPRYIGGTTDLAHVLIRSQVPLTKGAAAGDIYEWSGGSLALVSVLAPNEHGEELPAEPEDEGDDPLLGSRPQYVEITQRAISSDGARVVWQFGSKLYMRDTHLGQTIELDAAEPACLEEGKCKSGGGQFQIASIDGSSVLFTDTEPLTKNAVAGNELYECQIAEAAGRLVCDLTDLTPPTGSKEAPQVLGEPLGASEDDTTFYFAANGVLAAGAHKGDCGGSESQVAITTCNLYVHRGGVTSYITTLSGSDNARWAEAPEYQLTGVSPDGNWLTFPSVRSLTGYDNRDAANGQPDAEVYVYDASSGHLLCASCEPTGARPIGVEYDSLTNGESEALVTNRGEFGTQAWVSALLPHTEDPIRGTAQARPQRFIFNDGRLFFESVDALVPEDVNGTGDVYEYEPPGVGGCGEASATFAARSGGCISLISSGSSPATSTFLDASADGSDVFFGTTAKLVPEDFDANQDVYDAHECTAASPCLPAPVAQPPACVTEASCKAAPSPQPAVFGAPASATFSGPGNLVPSVTPPKPKTAVQIRAEKLAKAMKACKKDQNRRKRGTCERQARKRYGPRAATKTSDAKKPVHKLNRRAR